MVPDGLLLYSGPSSNPEPGSTENFIAIGEGVKKLTVFWEWIVCDQCNN